MGYTGVQEWRVHLVAEEWRKHPLLTASAER